MTNPTTVEELLDYWPGNIPFNKSLVSEDGSCMCAQGQALHFLDDMSAEDLKNLPQAKADKRIAELFGISLSHAVLLRIVNDTQDGSPASVIRNPEQVIGDQVQVVLAFWWHLHRMSGDDWAAARARANAARIDAASIDFAWETAGIDAQEAAQEAAGIDAQEAAQEAAGKAAWATAQEAAGIAAWAASGKAAWAAARATAWAAAQGATGAAARATNEIQGAAVMRAKGLPFFFLPLFGYPKPEAILEAS